MQTNTGKLHAEIPATTEEHYKIIKLLGKGAFGEVMLGVHKLTGKKVAIKTIDKKYMSDDFSRRKVFQEVFILKKIKHANVIRLLEVFEGAKHMFIVMEYAGGGDLLKYVKFNGKLREDEASNIFRQILYGLGHIHSRSVLHRDMKLDNILFDDEGGVKICDFGVSRIIRRYDIIKEQCGTPAYIAPEVILNDGYCGFYADHWSIGILLYAMLCASVPFKAQNITQLLEVIKSTPISFPTLLSRDAQDLIKSLLRIDPASRLSIPEILQHPWMRNSIEEDEEFLNYLECKNMDADYDHPNINLVNVGNLFFRSSSTELLSYNDYACISQDFYTHKIEEEALRIMESYGYPRELVVQALENNDLNHATATYNLLCLPQYYMVVLSCLQF